jgi:hypothetical protein
MKIRMAETAYQIPDLAVILLFYQITQNQSKQNRSFLVIYSIFQDVLQSMPLGTTIISYILFIKLIEVNRRYIFDHGAIVSLAGFGLAFSGLLLFKLLISIATYGFAQVATQYYCLELLYMIGYYPLFHNMLNKVLDT